MYGSLRELISKGRGPLGIKMYGSLRELISKGRGPLGIKIHGHPSTYGDEVQVPLRANVWVPAGVAMPSVNVHPARYGHLSQADDEAAFKESGYVDTWHSCGDLGFCLRLLPQSSIFRLPTIVISTLRAGPGFFCNICIEIRTFPICSIS